jgi:hypothetical protein
MKKILKIIVLALVLLIGAFFIYLFSVTRMNEPEHKQISDNELPVIHVNDSLSQCGDSWLKINKFGMWELYVQGDPYTMGLKNGRLTKKLVHYQEEAFVEQINKLVPSGFFLQFLRVFLGWFNRDMLDYVPEEYQLEVAGVSKSASPEFKFIAPAFQRIMSYHGAHDMGHALQSMTLVGCTSFGVWNNYSEDSTLLIGRNFDFYAGDRFSENKIVAFVQPDNGHAFMSVTWGGMVGVVSGMNEEGLTITLNAKPTGIPKKSTTPVSILARKILQYASTIDEAFKISKEYETFVSESFLIGSGKENRVALIEKTQDKTLLFNPQKDYLTVTNHFLNPFFNQLTKESNPLFEDASHYRQKCVEAIIDSIKTFSVRQMAYVLRDNKGKNSENIGFGNEKAINQFIAHHGIIFKPGEKKVWVSAAPFQLGTFIAYDLDEIFADPHSYQSKNVYLKKDCIEPDTILNSEGYKSFLQYKKTLLEIQDGIDNKRTFTQKELDDFISLNNKYYYPWFFVGNYYFKNKMYLLALPYYSKAIELEIPQQSVFDELTGLIDNCKEKLSK